MSGIQILLIFGISLLAIYYLLRLKRSVVDMLLMLALISTAILFVLWPQLTHRLAHFLGVGRGADLVYYVCILLFSFGLMKLYSRIRRLEQQFTQLIREDALNQKKVVDPLRNQADPGNNPGSSS
jgi:hypothetical protein